MGIDLSTTFLGMKLKNPLVIGACPLTGDVERLVRLEQAGAAAAVLPSLFEEQIEHDAGEMAKVHEFGTDSFAEALTYFPEMTEYRIGPEAYLQTLAEAKRATSMPIIASLNGASRGGWVRHAKMMQDAGADALELNVFFVAADLHETGRDVEARYLELVADVRRSVSIPLAVKLGPYFSALGDMARRLAEAGADGLVLFNRFYQPDIDLDGMEAQAKLQLSSPSELLLPLRWIALLHGRVDLSLAATGGIHDAIGLLKALAAGADAGMIASVLYLKGERHIETILAELRQWMERKGYDSIEQFKGVMSLENCPDPTAFQRGNYMKALLSFTGKPI